MCSILKFNWLMLHSRLLRKATIAFSLTSNLQIQSQDSHLTNQVACTAC